jgi:hypothetical protein
MRYIKFQNGLITEVQNDYPKDGPWSEDRQNGWLATRDAESYEEACTWAAYMTAMTGTIYLGTDATANTSPRYGVVEAPKVGDKVSTGFNGDYYPCGIIEKITPTWRITTSTGKKFSRRGTSGSWREQGRGWSMVAGHIDERNPSF